MNPETAPLPTILLVVPTGPLIYAKFVAHLWSLSENQGQRALPIIRAMPIGALVAMNMREVAAATLEPTIPHWDRMVVIETDMLPPHDALVKHALHTQPIVGSVYYLHEAPHHLVAMRDHGNGPQWMSKAEQNEIEDNPGLHAVDMVGLGCTSISRAVFEEWPKEVPIFRNSIMPDALQTPGTRGEVSHDYWFCLKAREFQVPIFIDSTIVCDQLTLVPIGRRQHEQHQGFVPALADAPDVDLAIDDLAFVRT